MLTVFVRVLPDSDWVLAHNQRVRVHLGTAEVLARVAFLEAREAILPGERGWIQLRLEAPVVARALDHVVIRSYSPMVTVGGGIVAEPTPHKRRALDASATAALVDLVEGAPSARLKAVLGEASWEGVERRRLPVLLGSPASECDEALAELDGKFLETATRVFGFGTVEEGRALILAALDAEHAADSLRGEVPLSRLRIALPQWADARLADALMDDLAGRGALHLVGGGARRPGFTPEATPEQEAHLELLQGTYASAGLAAPTVPELPEAVAGRDDLWSLLRVLEGRGSLTLVADALYMDTDALEQAVALVRTELGGREGLGPSDFRDTLDVSRKHLIPLLNYLDGLGVTRREDKVRSVPSG
jgi:selenocysteine-specific elongation factor